MSDRSRASRRLRTTGILLPVGCIIALEAARTLLERQSFWSLGVFDAWHLLSLAVVVAGIVVFALFMFRLIDRTQRQLADAVGDLNRRKDEGHAFYDILLRVSNQDPPTPVLAAVAQHAATLLRADAAAITVAPETAQSVRFESASEAATVRPDGTVVVGYQPSGSPAGGSGPGHPAYDPAGESSWEHVATRVVDGGDAPLGEIWVARAGGQDFSDRDRGFLATLASLVGIALTAATAREGSRQRAILNERTRIAREMHDSLAQVLGAVHLRLRALETGLDSIPTERAVAEVEALADICAEAYRDVREAILGLRDADRHAERSLEDNLRAYLGSYSSQSGVATTLTNEVGHGVALSPRAEVHVIRIVQEALTNVRKHARAQAVVVSIRGTDTTTSFVVQDDGVGFDSDASSRSTDGYGLFTMRDRAALLGGTVQIDSAVGRGTTVTATIPERPHPTRADHPDHPTPIDHHGRLGRHDHHDRHDRSAL